MERRLGYVIYTLGLHPDLYGAMHQDFLSPITQWLWNFAPTAHVPTVEGCHLPA